jgi:hypothetical protein
MVDPNLSQTLENAKPSTSITGPSPEAKSSVDDMLETVERYFMDSSYSCGKCYNDGYSVELIKDDLDATTLLSSLTRIIFDSIRQDPGITAERKVELSLMYQSIDNILQIIKHSKKNVAHNDILCKIIGYCMKNYQIYNNNNTHDRSRKV